MRDLLLTLGHNASAILVQDGSVLNAYEAERLTGVKSDSRFPADAIQTLIDRGENFSGKPFDRVYVTHWDPSGDLKNMKQKYWDPDRFASTTPIISQESLKLTHHDCHAHAAVAFAGSDFPERDVGVLVVDGFGTKSEHISYYRMSNGRMVLTHRVFGYETSLGLMYQYVTSALGLKMHEDEYKLLGYGSKIPVDQMDRANEVSLRFAKELLKRIRGGPNPRTGIGLDALPAVQERWGIAVADMIHMMGMHGTDRSSAPARIVVGYIVQRVLETVILNLLEQDFGWAENLICTGGCFFNVALNRMITKKTKGKVCFMPLAGDQGNSIGLWQYHNQKLEFEFDDLCWGIRDMELDPTDAPDGLLVCDENEAVGVIEENLEQVGFVNIVRGKMEFGPRALCNTTTLARADDPNIAAQINIANDRNEVMPFAPVIWGNQAEKIFPEIRKLHKSEKFMICAMDYNKDIGSMFPGAALRTAFGQITGRPQMYERKSTKDPVADILSQYGLLINTSFNVHGVPICCDIQNVVHSHQFQRERNPNVTTVVILQEKT